MKKNVFTIFLITLAVLVTRLPFITRELFHWDTVQYIYGAMNYNFAAFHPHPPGYYLYVKILSVMNIFISSFHYSMILLNFLCIISSLFLLAKTGENISDKSGSMIAVLLLLLSPVIWMYNVVSMNHLYLLVFPSVLLYFSSKKNEISFAGLFALSVFAGLSSGIRQIETLLFLPMLLIIILFNTREKKYWAACAAGFMISYLVWFIPFVYESGGLSIYKSISKYYYVSVCFDKSILYGASFSQHLMCLPRVILWLIADFGIMGNGVILLLTVKILKNKKFINPFTGREIIFLLAGIIPSLIFLLLVYAGRPAYWFSLLPFFFYIAGRLFNSNYTDTNKNSGRNVLVILAVLSVLYFAAPGIIIRMKIQKELQKEPEKQNYTSIESFISKFKYSSAETYYRDWQMKTVAGSIAEFSRINNYEVAGYVDFGGVIDWRRISYYINSIPLHHTERFFNHADTALQSFVSFKNQVHFNRIYTKNPYSKDEIFFETDLPEKTRKFIIIDNPRDEQYLKIISEYPTGKISIPPGYEAIYLDFTNNPKKSFVYKNIKYNFTDSTIGGSYNIRRPK